MKRSTRYLLAAAIGAAAGVAVHQLKKRYSLSYSVSVEKNDDFCWLPSIKITKVGDEQAADESEHRSAEAGDAAVADDASGTADGAGAAGADEGACADTAGGAAEEAPGACADTAGDTAEEASCACADREDI